MSTTRKTTTTSSKPDRNGESKSNDKLAIKRKSKLAFIDLSRDVLIAMKKKDSSIAGDLTTFNRAAEINQSQVINKMGPHLMKLEKSIKEGKLESAINAFNGDSSMINKAKDLMPMLTNTEKYKMIADITQLYEYYKTYIASK